MQDPTLFKAIDVFAGLKASGYLLVNTNKTFADLHLGPIVAKLPKGHAVTVPATEFALKHVGRPVPNAALLGAFAALTGIVHLDMRRQGDRRGIPRQGRRRQYRRRHGGA